MPRAIPTPISRMLGLSLLILLGACAQQREPGYYDTPRGDTRSDALHRAQGGASTVAPAQLQLGFGNQNQKPAPETPNASSSNASQAAGAEPGAVAAPGATAPGTAPQTRGDIPQVLKETKTYLGTIACTDGGQCPASRMTLTLAPDGQWRARQTPVDGSGPARTTLGCWFLTGSDPVRIVLQTGEQPYASLEFTQSSVLKVVRMNGKAPLLASRLTRQADLDPISELSAKPAQACPAN
ncbi:hypothetical protein [Castellaniella sp. MT123]|uniref:hypothetical protein n=1 Tax=Castellaniella sp. MT123 TaxID=3140381 RepID=UPI0031F3A747